MVDDNEICVHMSNNCAVTNFSSYSYEEIVVSVRKSVKYFLVKF